MDEQTTPQPQAQPEPAKKDKKDKKVSGADIAAMNARLEKAEEAGAVAKDALLRTAAEYENFRKRTAKEKEESFANGVTHATTAILPILDTLQLAANAPCTDEEYKKGVEMTLSKCTEVFKTLGIEEIAALGEQFDPELHSAVLQQESEEESGTVINVLQKGYTLNGKVVRHSCVAVAE